MSFNVVCCLGIFLCTEDITVPRAKWDSVCGQWFLCSVSCLPLRVYLVWLLFILKRVSRPFFQEHSADARSRVSQTKPSSPGRSTAITYNKATCKSLFNTAQQSSSATHYAKNEHSYFLLSEVVCAFHSAGLKFIELIYHNTLANRL